MHFRLTTLAKKIVSLLFFCILLTACASQSTEYRKLILKNATKPAAVPLASQRTASLKHIDDEINYFMEIVLGSEYGMGDFTIKKWRTDIRVEVSGHPTLQDLSALKQVITDLNEVVQPEIHIALTRGHGNVKLMFIPHSEFYQYEPPGIIFYGGFFRTWWHPTGEIYKGCVVIGSDHIDQKHRSHLIREELTQTLGLMNDSMKFEDSIFYQGNSDVSSYSSLDKRVIKRLYSSEIHAGMNTYQIRELLNK